MELAAEESFAASVSDALQPNPNSTLRRLEDSFGVSLDTYGIKEKKASGGVSHIVHDNGDYEVISEIGEHLASFSSLTFVKERIEWNPPKYSRISE